MHFCRLGEVSSKLAGRLPPALAASGGSYTAPWLASGLSKVSKRVTSVDSGFPFLLSFALSGARPWLLFAALVATVSGAIWRCMIRSSSGAGCGWPPWCVAAAMHCVTSRESERLGEGDSSPVPQKDTKGCFLKHPFY